MLRLGPVPQASHSRYASVTLVSHMRYICVTRSMPAAGGGGGGAALRGRTPRGGDPDPPSEGPAGGHIPPPAPVGATSARPRRALRPVGPATRERYKHV
eukprot:6012475-Pyramimonas_sp.AAC.1